MDNFDRILEMNYLNEVKTVSEYDEVYKIFYQNDKYLKIGYDCNFWNVLDLMGYKYKLSNKSIVLLNNHQQNELFQKGTQIYRINNKLPWKGLIEKKDKYMFEYFVINKNANKIYSSTVVLNIPVQHKTGHNYVESFQNELYIKLDNFNSIDNSFLELVKKRSRRKV